VTGGAARRRRAGHHGGGGAPVGDHAGAAGDVDVAGAAEDGGVGHPPRRLQVHAFLRLKQPSLRVMLRDSKKKCHVEDTGTCCRK
jgi:hypothetical protein